MPSSILQRPVFREGQVLESDDLTRLLQYSRDQDARHERYLHTWGIALGLSVEEQNGEFVLQTGFAIDSSGGPVLVAKPIILSVDQLYDEALPSDKDDGKLFPLFVVRTQAEQSDGGMLQSCATGGMSRISEGATVQFRPFATDWDKQPIVDVSDGPVDRAQSDRVVLVGFVQWKLKPGLPKGQIAKFHRRDQANGVGPRYVGVAADDVVGSGGELTVRSKSPGTLDAPAVVIGDHETGEHQNAFAVGLDDGGGNINHILTIDPKGNVHLKGGLTADGPLKGQIRSGEIAVESGIASDGLTLPLPPGIDPERVKKGEIVVHATVSPRIDRSVDSTIKDDHVPAVLECNVDENRLVRCRIRWFKLGSTDKLDIAASVNYTVIASVAASTGGA